MTRKFTSKPIVDFIREYLKTPEDSTPVMVGIHRNAVYITLSQWGNTQSRFTKRLLELIEQNFGITFEYIEPAEESVVMATFSR